MGKRAPNDPVILKAKLPIGEAAIWELIKEFDAKGEPWSAAMIDAETNRPLNSVSNYIYRLRKAGFARVVHTAPSGKKDPTPFFRLARKPVMAPRLTSKGTEAPPRSIDLLWPAIRSLKQFSLRELAFAATVDKPIPVRTARQYVEELRDAGYLAELPRPYARHTASYRLKPSMNTGPKAPHALKVRGVWDPNARKVMGDAVAEEVA